MFFEEILKELHQGKSSKVLAEKLFENLNYQEVQPILKEIQ